MPRTMGNPSAGVTYPQSQPVRTVEVALGRRMGRTPEAAHQLLLRIRAVLGDIGESFVEARAWDRAVWWLHPWEVATSRMPVLALGEAVRQASRIDGIEDAELTALAAALDSPDQARRELRHLSAEIGAKQQLYQAICRHHGWQA